MTMGLPWSSSGTKGTGGAGIPAAMVLSSSGAAWAAATNPAITSAVAGRATTPARTVSTGWSLYFRRVTTPKFPPPPRSAQNSSGRVLASAWRSRPSRSDDLGGEQIVNGHPVLAHQEADSAGERDAADANRPGVAEARREAVRARRGAVLAGGQSGAGPRRTPGGVDLERAQRRQVDDDAAVAHAVARRTVATATDR
jgi:hypothetical protein